MSTPSSQFQAIDDNFAIDGLLSSSALEYIVENYTSVLYICTDDGDDRATETGFELIQQRFPFPKSSHIPFNHRDECYSSTYPASIKTRHACMKAYLQFEAALDKLEKPVAIVCKSSRRAGAVYSAFKGYKEGLTSSEILAFSSERGFSYIQSEGMSTWVRCVLEAGASCTVPKPLIFRQLFEAQSSTYTYLLVDPATMDAVLIDPVLETVARDAEIVRDLGANLTSIINTHVHADHITGSGALKTLFPGSVSVISLLSTGNADVHVNNGDEIKFGGRSLLCLSTPGHTAGCFTFLLDDFSRVFTGDALLIRGCGRTDFQGGSSDSLYDGVHSQILQALPSGTLVYPAHDYKGNTCSSVGEEKSLNPRLSKSKTEFIEIMEGLNLPPPKKLDISVPANLRCGV